MKMKKWIVSLLSCSLAVGVANAGIHVIYEGPMFKGADACSAIAGDWKGNGKISAMNGKIQCTYEGTGTISPVSGNQYTFAIHLHPTSVTPPGMPCIPMEATLKTMCQNGNVSVEDNGISLHGSTDGTTANFKNGTVMIGNIKANIDSIDLWR